MALYNVTVTRTFYMMVSAESKDDAENFTLDIIGDGEDREDQTGFSDWSQEVAVAHVRTGREDDEE